MHQNEVLAQFQTFWAGKDLVPDTGIRVWPAMVCIEVALFLFLTWRIAKRRPLKLGVIGSWGLALIAAVFLDCALNTVLIILYCLVATSPFY
jgi:hypothetical protein